MSQPSLDQFALTCQKVEAAICNKPDFQWLKLKWVI